MLKITQISRYLDVSVRQVHNYIQSGHLRAELVNGVYQIEDKDYHDFLDNYWSRRHTGKGTFAVPSDEQFRILRDFVEDAENTELEYETFHTLYRDIKSLIPPIDVFIAYKRNRQIVYDRIEKGMPYKDIAAKYKLSVISIKKIVSKSQEKEDSVY